jgi:hypothetical protein
VLASSKYPIWQGQLELVASKTLKRDESHWLQTTTPPTNEHERQPNGHFIQVLLAA